MATPNTKLPTLLLLLLLLQANWNWNWFAAVAVVGSFAESGCRVGRDGGIFERFARTCQTPL